MCDIEQTGAGSGPARIGATVELNGTVGPRVAILKHVTLKTLTLRGQLLGCRARFYSHCSGIAANAGFVIWNRQGEVCALLNEAGLRAWLIQNIRAES